MPRQYRSLYDDFFSTVNTTDKLKKEMDELSQEMKEIIQENPQQEKTYMPDFTHLIAQDQMLEKLTTFLKEIPMSVPRSLLLCGPKGVGKHTAIKKQTILSYNEQRVKNKDPFFLDLSGYQEIQLFYQDFYMILNQSQSVIVLEHLSQAIPTLQKAITELLDKGSILLPKRYLPNQGQLVEAPQVLGEQLVSRLYAKGQWIILLEDLSRDQAISRLGNQLVSHLDDIIEAQALDPQARKKILDDLWNHFKLSHPTLKIEPNAYQKLIESYDPQLGIHSFQQIFNQLDKWIGSKNGRLDYKNNQWYLDDQSLSPELFVDHELENELNKIVGLHQIKDYLISLDQLVRMNERRQKQGLKMNPLNLHMIFNGNPGTGKTTIARLLGRYLKAKGLVSNGQLVEVARQDLVANYAGQTATKTKTVIDASLGGILFIDEAYSLYRGKEDSFGLEAIDTLVKYMEDYRDQFVCILAGYEKEMKVFLSANSGLASRFSKTLHFADYTPFELMQITCKLAQDQDYQITQSAKQYLEDFYSQHPSQNGNGRFARNVLESAILHQASRLIDDDQADLTLLDVLDFANFKTESW